MINRLLQGMEFEASRLCDFGGSSQPSGGGTQTSTSTTTTELSPEQKELLALALPVAKEFVEQPPTLFPGTSIAGFNELQTTAQQDILTAAATQVAPLAQAGTTAQQTLLGPNLTASTLGQLILLPRLLNPQDNPVLQQAITGAIRPLGQELTQTILPAVRGSATEAGQFGGSRQGIAEGIASQAFLTQAGDISAALTNRAFESGQETAAGLIESGLLNAVRSLSLLPSTAQLPFAAPGAVAAVGEQQRSLEQARLTEEANKFFQAQILPFAAAQEAAQLAFGIGGGTATTLGTAPGPTGPSDIQTALGIASLIASLFGGGFG